MCKILNISRSTYYSFKEKVSLDDPLTGTVIKLFNENQHAYGVNEEKIANILNRKFDERKPFEIIVSDLTYVRVKNKWHYICIVLDLHNREIIGYSCGPHKTAQLVYDALAKIKANLFDLQIFHTDRGSEFKNYLIDDLLKEFNIQRSLSAKGCPYDNAVAEAQFKIIKTEFIRKGVAFPFQLN